MFKTTRVLLIFLLSYLHSITCNEQEVIIQKWISYLPTKLGSCSEYFHYQRVDEFINGKLELYNLKMGDTVKMTFNKNDFDHHPQFNGIFLPDESSQTVINRLQNGQIITYRIDFPLTTDVPTLIKIFVNGNKLCATKYNASEEIIVFQHTLKIINGLLPVFTSNINIPKFVQKEIPNGGLSPLIYGGSEIMRGEYPWLTAIYKKQKRDLFFMCGGSLITPTLILTAAHCFQGSSLNVTKLVVMLGRHDLSNDKEESFVIRQIKSLIIHPEYKYGRGFSDADLALLELKNNFHTIHQTNLFVEQSCRRIIENQACVVAGWGDDDEGMGISRIPKKVKMNIVSEAVCLRSSVAFNAITSARTLCAGNRDGTGPCEGDSGGGLMINENGRWMLRGVISAGLVSKQRCNLLEYTVYCDIAKHISWLQANIDQREPSVTTSIGAICGKSDTEQEEQPITKSAEDICGRSDMKFDGEHPWFGAIYRKLFTGLQFSSTGALIPARYLLGRATAFIYFDGELISPDRFRIYFGRYDLNKIQANGVVSRDVATVIFHPDFQLESPLPENNIVLIQMTTAVSFTIYVKPICLWSEPNERQSDFLAQSAALSSWDISGVFDNSLTVPTSIKVNITSIQGCESWGYNESISLRVFCVSRLENKNGGFLMIKQNERWFLRGINALRYNYDTYMSKDFYVFSDIIKYLLWIQGNMNT